MINPREMYILSIRNVNLIHLSHDITKPTQWHLRPAKIQVSLGIRPVWSEFSLSAWRKPGVLSYPLSAQWRLWSDWAAAQVDLSLRWAHSHFVGFVMSQLIYCMNTHTDNATHCKGLHFLHVLHFTILWIPIFPQQYKQGCEKQAFSY